MPQEIMTGPSSMDELACSVTMVTCPVLSLPQEILELIWICHALDHSDVCRLAIVCSKFRITSSSNEVWRQKFANRWPGLLELYPKHMSVSWQLAYQLRHYCHCTVHSKLATMSAKYFQKEEVSREGFQDFEFMLTQHERASQFVIDELLCIIHDGNCHANLTKKYYAAKILRFVQHFYLRNEWEKLLSFPRGEILLEKGALLLAQWCQPSMCLTEGNLAKQLDSLAERVRKQLEERNPSHPVCKAMVHKYLEGSLWSSQQNRQILEAINHILFHEMGFHGNEENYYDPLNSMINKVLERKTGIPISLAVVYIAVARRLGVLCEAVNFPSHFLIKWKEFPHLDNLGQAYTFIDVFQRGKFLSEQDCHSILDIPIPALMDKQCYETIPPRKVFERMARNLVNIGRQQGQMGDGLLCLRNAVELLLTICPDDMDSRILLARLYIHLGINLTEVIDVLQGLAASDRNAPTGLIGYLAKTADQMIQDEKDKPNPEPVVPKYRNENSEVLFSVGMIMKHKRYHYICVVCGWDSKCEASQEWIVQMGVHTLPRKQYQPFYNVLVEDGSNRYAAQENLELAPEPKVVTHPEVGKFFQEFCGTYYFANQEKESQYPDDTEVTRRAVGELCNQEEAQ